jgi:hypothetical protein
MRRIIFICTICISSITFFDCYSQISTNGLLAKFDFNLSLKDSLFSNLAGSNSGVSFSVDRNGKLNSCLEFNSSSDKILYSITDTSKLYLPKYSHLSISFWIKPNFPALSINDRIIGFFENDGIPSIEIIRTTTGNNLLFNMYYQYNQSYTLKSFDTISGSNWSHIVVTYDTILNKTKMFINKILIDSSSMDLHIPKNLQYGMILGNNSVNNWGYSGKFDDLRIYNRVITMDEINFLYNETLAGCTISSLYNTTISSPCSRPDCLIASFDFNGNANDSEISKLIATVSGAILTTDRFEIPNSAYEFDSNSDRISFSIEDTSSLYLPKYSQISISLWYKANYPALADNDRILSFTNDINGRIPALEIHRTTVGNNLQFNNYVAYLTSRNIKSVTTITNSEWTHLVLMYDTINNISEIVINGKSEIKGNFDLSIPTKLKNNGFIIGNNAVNNWGFNGKIDDIKIYNKILTSCEILELQNVKKEVVTLIETNPKNNEKLFLAPNPGSGFIEIQNINEKLIAVSLINLQGVIYSTKFFENHLDVSEIPKGLYFVKIETITGRIIFLKLVID